MGVKMDYAAFDRYMGELSKDYRIMGPVRIPGKGKFSGTDVIGYGEVKSYADLILDEKSYYSPKEIFYPIRETLFYFFKDDIQTPAIEEKPVLAFVRPCDLNGIRRLDTIFLKNGEERDFYYERRRKLIKFAMIECLEGFDSCFCVSMGSNESTDYEMALRFGQDDVRINFKDMELAKQSVLEQNQPDDFAPDFIRENKVKVQIPPVDKVTPEHFNHPLWLEYTQRCIACGRCNTSCITCSCFTMQDVAISDDRTVGERRRVWASCHVGGYSDMAGGHSFRKQNGERMRFKTMHKINDYYKRFGEHMCVGCGRCDDVCPEYISFSKCINKLNAIIEEVDKNA